MFGSKRSLWILNTIAAEKLLALLSKKWPGNQRQIPVFAIRDHVEQFWEERIKPSA
jgi:hypothetical protein